MNTMSIFPLPIVSAQHLEDGTILVDHGDNVFTGGVQEHELTEWLAEDPANEIRPYEPPAPPTPEEKLAASGLTVDELKALLSIK